MSTAEAFSFHTQIDTYFNLDTLIRLATEITSKSIDLNNSNAQVSKVAHNTLFKRHIAPINQEIDIKVTNSDGTVDYILYGSTFYFNNFRRLQDTTLNEALDTYAQLLPPSIGRAEFYDALLGAEILIGILTIPTQETDFSKEDIQSLIERCLFSLNPQRETPPEQVAILLYGCMRIIENRLKFPIERDSMREP